MTTLPYLSETDLAGLNLTTYDIIACIENAVKGAANGTVWSAAKAVIQPQDGRYMMAALAAMDGPSLLTVKTVVLNPDNPDAGLPQINGLVTMLDSSTGLPVAILDGNWITAVRTAGLSAVAANHMARKDAASIGFVGCGVQAQSHLDAFCEMFPITHIKLFGRGQTKIDLLTEAAQKRGLTVERCDTGQAAIEDVDLAVTTITATGGPKPFLDAGGMKQGAFAAVVDLGVPWISDSFGALDSVVIDDLAQEAALPNKLCHQKDVTGDLSQLVLGQIPARQSPGDRNAFVFRGHALGDLALSALAWERHQNQ